MEKKNEDVNQVGDTVKLSLKEVTLRKANKRKPKDRDLDMLETGECPTFKVQSLQKRKNVKSNASSPKQLHTTKILRDRSADDYGDTIGGAGAQPLRRSARQAARAFGSGKELAVNPTSTQPKRSRKEKADSCQKVDARSRLDATLEEPEGRKAGVVGTGGGGAHKRKAKKARSKKKRDQNMTAAAGVLLTAQDNLVDEADKAVSEKGDDFAITTGGDTAVEGTASTRSSDDVTEAIEANIAELKRFMQENATTTRIQRY